MIKLSQLNYPLNDEATASTSTSPPRKKSKWAEQADEEDLSDKKRARKEELLKQKLIRERQVREGKVNNSREGSAAGGVRGGGARVGGTRRIRDMHPALESCRSVYCYERLNHIEEGSYGIVFRARCKTTGAIVALKKLKMDKEKNGFPITSLREIQTLMVAGHENIVRVREIVVGDTLTQVFIVMDFIEHDLKSLLATMPTPFLASEIKTLLLQLLSAIALCHDNWIVHRDLKTSNLLMNNRGQIKVADFGLARTYGDPLGDMTQLVVTLWYRSPELLLGATEYSTAVDMWSIGCIFGELILKEPLLPGKGEIDQVSKIFKLLGRPTEEIWPGFSKLPNAKSFNLSSAQPFSNLRQTFRYTTSHGLDLLSQLLAYDPEKRISAEQALKHPYFSESPLPKHSDLFASFPSVAGGEK
ncbi:cell division cycle 2-like, partial [Phenoliferia sp. Uapishka_3]